MTEAEWLSCVDPEVMLAFLDGRLSERKMQMFAVACVRRTLDLCNMPESQAALELAERYADGAASAEEIRLAYDTSELAYYHAKAPTAADWGACLLLREGAAAAQQVLHFTVRFVEEDRNGLVLVSPRSPLDLAAQAALLRELVGNPYRSVCADPSWLVWNAGAVVHLAQAVYTNRAFDDMPILADALEETGCTDVAILEHCRSGGPHVRGCWVVDALLGKR